MDKLICENCEKEFEEGYNYLFCSEQCVNEYDYKLQQEETNRETD